MKTELEIKSSGLQRGHRDHVDGSQDPPASRVDSPSMAGAGMIGTRGWLA